MKECKGMEVKFHAFLMISFSVTLLLAYLPPHMSLTKHQQFKVFQRETRAVNDVCMYVQGIMPAVYLSVCRSIYLSTYPSTHLSVHPSVHLVLSYITGDQII